MADGNSIISAEPRRKPPRGPKPHELRRRMEMALERLLEAVEGIVADLDALDGDPDLEPSLGASNETTINNQANWFHGCRDNDIEGPIDDNEETLGWSENIDQVVTGRERNSPDEEPSLGSTNDIDQRSAWGGSLDRTILGVHEDFEEQCEDEGFDSDRELEVGDGCDWPDQGYQTVMLPAQGFCVGQSRR